MGLEHALVKLTRQQRIYVQSRLEGMSKVASAAAAGSTWPGKDYVQFEESEAVQEALLAAMQQTAEEVGFTRKEAHDLLMDSYRNAATAGEQVAAVREMIKLHGIAAPQQVEVKHQHVHEGELHLLPNDELMRLANIDRNELTLEGEFKRLPEPIARDGEYDET